MPLKIPETPDEIKAYVLSLPESHRAGAIALIKSRDESTLKMRQQWEADRKKMEEERAEAKRKMEEYQRKHSQMAAEQSRTAKAAFSLLAELGKKQGRQFDAETENDLKENMLNAERPSLPVASPYFPMLVEAARIGVEAARIGAGMTPVAPAKEDKEMAEFYQMLQRRHELEQKPYQAMDLGEHKYNGSSKEEMVVEAAAPGKSAQDLAFEKMWNSVEYTDSPWDVRPSGMEAPEDHHQQQQSGSSSSNARKKRKFG